MRNQRNSLLASPVDSIGPRFDLDECRVSFTRGNTQQPIDYLDVSMHQVPVGPSKNTFTIAGRAVKMWPGSWNCQAAMQYSDYSKFGFFLAAAQGTDPNISCKALRSILTASAPYLTDPPTRKSNDDSNRMNVTFTVKKRNGMEEMVETVKVNGYDGCTEPRRVAAAAVKLYTEQ